VNDRSSTYYRKPTKPAVNKKALIVDVKTTKKSAKKRVIAIASRKSERLAKNNFKFLYLKLCVILCVFVCFWDFLIKIFNRVIFVCH
jgi:hypothetical protein